MNIATTSNTSFEVNLNSEELLFFAILGIQASIMEGLTEYDGKKIDDILADCSKLLAQKQFEELESDEDFNLQ